VRIEDFDKTFFTCEEGSMNFNNVKIKNGNLTKTKPTFDSNGTMLMVNSMLFDVFSANFTLNNSHIENIYTPHSAPVMFITVNATLDN